MVIPVPPFHMRLRRGRGSESYTPSISSHINSPTPSPPPPSLSSMTLCVKDQSYRLPDDLIVHLALHLATEDFLALSLTCRRYYQLLNEPSTWRLKVRSEFPQYRWVLHARTHSGWPQVVYRGLCRSRLLMWSEAMDVVLRSTSGPAPSTLPVTIPTPRLADDAPGQQPPSHMQDLNAVAGFHVALGRDNKLWRIFMTPRLKWSSLDLPFTPVSWSAGSSHAMFLDTKGQVWELYPPLYHLAHSYIAVRQESVHAVHVSASSDISAFLTPDGRVYAWWSETPRMWRAHKNYLVATVSSVHYSDGRCQAQELPLVPTSGDEKVVSVEAGRGIVLALTSSGRLYLRYLGEVPQQRQWTHLPHYSSPDTDHIVVHRRAIATFASKGSEIDIVRFGMIGEWSLGVGGHTQPRLLKLDAPVVQVALGDEVQAALTTQGEVYTWKLQAQHVDNVLAKWSISLPTKRSVLWDACPSRACESPFVVTISESYGLRADLWMLGFAPEVEDKKRKSKLWGALSRGKKSVA